jgi:hypothetical protein
VSLSASLVDSSRSSWMSGLRDGSVFGVIDPDSLLWSESRSGWTTSLCCTSDFSDGMVKASRTDGCLRWNQPPRSHSPVLYKHEFLVSSSTMPSNRTFNRLKSIGFRIQPSNPALIYVCRSRSTREADTAKIGTRPLPEAQEERLLLECDFSNDLIILVEVSPSTIGI